jgi:hypothetical protein
MEKFEKEIKIMKNIIDNVREIQERHKELFLDYSIDYNINKINLLSKLKVIKSNFAIASLNIGEGKRLLNALIKEIESKL